MSNAVSTVALCAAYAYSLTTEWGCFSTIAFVVAIFCVWSSDWADKK